MSRLTTPASAQGKMGETGARSVTFASDDFPPRASILMVDDQPARLLTYEAMLSGLGVECVRALSGAEALEKLLKQEFAVILLDVQMPEMDGFEVARLVREHPRMERMPIIFVTGVHVSELDQLKGYEVGAIDYIAVPVVPEILRSKIAMLVELHQRRSELKALNAQLQATRAQIETEHAQAIAEKDAQLQAAFEHPTDMTVVLRAQRDAQGKVSDWIYLNANSSALRLIGRDREDVIGRTVSEVLGEGAEPAIALSTQVHTTQLPIRYERHHQGKDLLITIFPAGGDRVVSSGVDITDRKQAEAALRRSEAKDRALIDSAPVGVAYNEMDGRFRYANRAFCELVGYTAEELNAKAWQDITHPDDLEADLALGRRVLARELSHYSLEKRYVRKNGTVVWARLFGNFVRDDAGTPIQGVAIAIDITERQRAEQSLREREERFRELANNIDQFAWTCDRLGYATWYNDRWYEYTGDSHEHLRGDEWRQFVEPTHLERVTNSLSTAVSAGKPWEDTYPLRGKDGTYRWFLTRAVPIRDTGGAIVRWFGTNTDVTEQRKLQEQLRQSDRRKDEFLAMLAHELRNPIAPIRNAAEVLARLFADEPQPSSLVGMIQRQSAHLSRILDDLLDVARVTQGRIELRREVLSVAACVELALETVQPQVQSNRHQLAFTRTAQPLYVNADKVRLEQCITNLLTNAVKYTDPGGEIRVRLYADNGDAVIEVADTGVGISAEFLPRVFDLFAQGERALDRSEGGLGIGLSVCKRLIEMHGGSVSASSKGIGYGATFALRIPLQVSPFDSNRPAALSSGSTQRVLIVDDNRDAADSLALCLALEGHETKAVYAAEAALDEVHAFAPSVVLLDIGLPRIDGYEVARRIKAERPDIRVVALTGYGQEEDKQRTAAAGFEAHLIKPVDMNSLKTVLRLDKPSSD